MVLAYGFLGEKLRLIEIIFILLSVGGAIVIVAGSAGANANSNNATITQMPWLYSALICNPFLVASGSVALRKMKKLNEYVVCWYLNVT